jgi:hypothetical protein
MKQFVIDTNSLIELNRFNKNVFKSLWGEIYQLSMNKTLFSVTEVYKELEKHDDSVKKEWEDKEYFFIDPGEKETNTLQFLEPFEKFQEYGAKTTNNLWADPYLIAYGLTINAIIITQESLKSKPERKIPYVCKELGIECMNLDNFMEYQNWEW